MAANLTNRLLAMCNSDLLIVFLFTRDGFILVGISWLDSVNPLLRCFVRPIKFMTSNDEGITLSG